MKIYDLKKSFDRFSLKIDKLDIPEGKIYGIVGPNGCGKTTAMKLMAGILEADSGHIDYEGLTSRDITMAFRKPYLIHDTVYKNLVYPLKIRNRKPDEKIVTHLLELAGLQDLRNQYALSLSSGEQQKLSLIRTFVFEPKLVFIDESFSNMDIESVALFEDYILNMQKENPITWVVISHQLSNIRRLCEHVFFMYDGEVKEDGLTDDVLDNPKSDDLKRYLHYA